MRPEIPNLISRQKYDILKSSTVQDLITNLLTYYFHIHSKKKEKYNKINSNQDNMATKIQKVKTCVPIPKSKDIYKSVPHHHPPSTKTSIKIRKCLCFIIVKLLLLFNIYRKQKNTLLISNCIFCCYIFLVKINKIIVLVPRVTFVCLFAGTKKKHHRL